MATTASWTTTNQQFMTGSPSAPAKAFVPSSEKLQFATLCTDPLISTSTADYPPHSAQRRATRVAHQATLGPESGAKGEFVSTAHATFSPPRPSSRTKPAARKEGNITFGDGKFDAVSASAAAYVDHGRPQKREAIRHASNAEVFANSGESNFTSTASAAYVAPQPGDKRSVSMKHAHPTTISFGDSTEPTAKSVSASMYQDPGRVSRAKPVIAREQAQLLGNATGTLYYRSEARDAFQGTRGMPAAKAQQRGDRLTLA
eukprot:TRINITY_DN14019_c0_g1_i1.p1 TRINITY_DN14019_c0_g1~~TRINITY_DN14019_c0_g1_i1.p1  ORF type:complete len:259 (-),score=56.39 TRINITY_DN14019_c0_g1_i1:69-845(-)